MSVYIKSVARRNPRDVSAPAKYFPTVTNTSKYTLHKFSKRISEQSSLSPKEVRNVLEIFLQQIPTILSEGHIVHLNEFGSFRLFVSGAGTELAEDCGIQNINRVRFSFRPGRLPYKRIQNIHFVKYTEKGGD